MDEEERYEILGNSLLVLDNEGEGVCNVFSLYECVDILNQQDVNIKYLQQLNNEIIIQNKNIIKDSQIVEQENKQLKQTQKQLAIEKLEQILNYMYHASNNHYPLPYEIKNFIENQIKDLNL